MGVMDTPSTMISSFTVYRVTPKHCLFSATHKISHGAPARIVAWVVGATNSKHHRTGARSVHVPGPRGGSCIELTSGHW